MPGSTAPQVAPGRAQSNGEVRIESGTHGTRPYALRPKKNIWVTVTSVLLAMVAIGGLFAIVTILGQPDDSQKDVADTETPVVDPDEKDALDKALSRKTGKSGKPELPPVDETPEYFSSRQWEVAWNKVNGYLVKLDVRTPIRNRSMTGVIVDSRGWVATSLSGLEDAGEVTVTLAGKNLTDDPPFRDLVDLSRGIIATAPQYDLALISINRAQVINLADIKLKDSDNVVEATQCLIARTPPPRHRQWLAECRIAKRGTLGELPEPMQRSIEKASLDADKDLRWLVFPPRLPTDLAPELAGSPVIDEDGTVVAINTGLTSGQNSFAVPAAVIRTLIDSVPAGVPETRPFPKAADMLRQTSALADERSSKDPEVSAQIQRERAFDAILQNLTRSADECRKTDWSAELESEYASMQNLAKYMDEAFEWLVRNGAVIDDFEDCKARLDEALEEITESIEDDLVRDEFLAGAGNQFFFSQVDKENPWFMISARVVTDQFNSPQVGGQDTVVFDVMGTGRNVMAAAGRDARSFKKGRRFLLFGQLAPQSSVNLGGDEPDAQVSLINVHTHFLLQNVERRAPARMPRGKGKGR